MSEDCTHDNIELRYVEFGNLILGREESGNDYDTSDADSPYGYHVIDAWCAECEKVFNAKETLEILKQTSLAEAVYKLNIEMLEQSDFHKMKYVAHQTLGRLTKSHYRKSVKEHDPIPEHSPKEIDNDHEFRERFNVIQDGELWKLLINGFRLPTYIVWDGVKGDVFMEWTDTRYFQIGTVSHDEEDTQEDGFNYAFHEVEDTYALSHLTEPEGRWTLADVLEESFEDLDDLVSRHAVYSFPKKHPCADPSPCRNTETYGEYPCDFCSRNEESPYNQNHPQFGDQWEAIPEGSCETCKSEEVGLENLPCRTCTVMDKTHIKNHWEAKE